MFKQKPHIPVGLRIIGFLGAAGITIAIIALIVNVVAMATGSKPPFGF